jgi:hypothetical protein
MTSPFPTDIGRPKEVAAARLMNRVMIVLLLTAMAALSAYLTYDQIALMIAAHGAELGKHFLHVISATQPLFTGLVFWFLLEDVVESLTEGSKPTTVLPHRGWLGITAYRKPDQAPWGLRSKSIFAVDDTNFPPLPTCRH